MNGEVIKFAVLAVVAVGALLRLPSAVRGRNVGIFAVLVLMLVGVGLGIDSIYLAVDGLLGNHNYANLVIRFSLFAIFVILGVKMARAFESPRAARLIVGPIGLFILAVCAVSAVVFFMVSDLPASSAGLGGYGDQRSVQWYARVGRIFPAYVAACLVVPAFKCARSRAASVVTRLAALMMGVGFSALVIYEVLRELRLMHGIWDVILPFSVVFLVAVGLTLFLVARYVGERGQRTKALPDR